MNREFLDKSWKQIVIIAILFWLCVPALVYLHFPDFETRGQFGDMFGTVNALFAGLAFAGLIYTMLLQREDLRIQSEELKLTRLEIAGQREQLAIQNETLRQQKFENTFFQMVKLLNDIVNSWTAYKSGGFDKPDQKIYGYEAFLDNFSLFKMKVYSSWQHQSKQIRISTSDIPINHVTDTLQRHSIKYMWAPYLNILTNIIELIDETPLIDKKFYFNILRSQFSGSESPLIFYYSLIPGNEKLRNYAAAYGLFDQLNPHELLDQNHINLRPYIIPQFRMNSGAVR